VVSKSEVRPPKACFNHFSLPVMMLLGGIQAHPLPHQDLHYARDVRFACEKVLPTLAERGSWELRKPQSVAANRRQEVTNIAEEASKLSFTLMPPSSMPHHTNPHRKTKPWTPAAVWS